MRESIKKPRARKNQSYQKLSSVDFQSFRSNVWKQLPEDSSHELKIWVIFGVIGVVTGAVAFLVDMIVANLVMWKWNIA
jgi:hypothetical protein